MGKNLIIRGGDFSKCGINESSYKGVCALKLNDRFNIIGTGGNTDLFERLIDYDDQSGNIGKRMSIYENDNREILYVPKGATLTLTGVAGLLLDYCVYNRQHDPMSFKINSITSVMQYGNAVSRSGQSQGPAHPYLVGTFSNKDASKYMTFTDGVQNSVTLSADSTQDRYIIFWCKKTDASAINIDNYLITYEVTLAE